MMCRHPECVRRKKEIARHSNFILSKYPKDEELRLSMKIILENVLKLHYTGD